MVLLREKLFLTRDDKIMKKFLILLVAICCLGCERKIECVTRSETHTTTVGHFTYVQYDGHEYLLWYNGTHRTGITHSPKCPCQNK
jgi:hypothetical protein